MIYKTYRRKPSSDDGRVWWIDEGHPLTDEKDCVCRAVEGSGWLMHTSVIARADLVEIVCEHDTRGQGV
jgi:hypothetical protein